MESLTHLLIESTSQLRSWLQINHAQKESVWLVKWKKESRKPYVAYSDIVDQLLCFGWVDSLPRKLDSEKSMLLISPRKPKSNWSGVNKKKVERLMKSGQMAPAGIKMVEIAKQNGTWNTLDEVEQLLVPDDLTKAFAKYTKAEFYFNRFPPSSKRGILEWIQNAKQETTRAKRIEETAQKASQNIKANFPKGRDAGPK
jgi:uncharacterized protein YdeI (YjbR/CyaY-like superfamily)